ncbi:AAA family ATPase [Actinomyces sp.]|uniref:AAA family ATPase n=1 Tax=Actinomyces sp. TaxID=29317 RepID=UPI0026DB81D8|nr:ATP-binding protein [Actinomyces sp.]MDO4900382.1 ATP-binding protein [Actinomyces sp.]
MSTAANTPLLGDLERAVVDLVRAGTRGQDPGVRRLATRLMRSVPREVSDASAFRHAVHLALATDAGLRLGSSDVPREPDTLQPLVDVEDAPDGRGLVLDSQLMASLRAIVSEYARADELRKEGVEPTRTVLLSGPPGVGKTMSAKWLAQEMELPLVSLDLSSAVSSYLGNSGRNIREVLRYARSGPCVLLLDEFDAIAKRRDDDADVGELKRIVNVILVELDRWPATSLLLAATNHSHLLDSAVFRRFERTLNYSSPGREQRRQILRSLADGRVDDDLTCLVADLTEGMTGSDLVRMWTLSVRRAVLEARPIHQPLLEEIARTSPRHGRSRDRLFYEMEHQLNLSKRQIAAMCGVTHPTVSKAIARYRRLNDERTHKCAAPAASPAHPGRGTQD